MISDRISDNIPPQMTILNMVIPILMHFCIFCLKLEYCKPHNAAPHPKKCDIINDIILFPTVYRTAIIFDVIQSDVALQKQVH